MPLPLLKSIDDAEPLSEKDKQLADDLIAVLRRHNALDRFGITLLHEHFPLGDHEVLLETTDCEARVQTIRPVPKEELTSLPYKETAWRLDTGTPMMSCICMIYDGKHTGEHRHIK
jgi:hypothetical protein